MPQNKVYLAIDLGASSGRVMAGIWDGQTIDLREVHRFASPSIHLPPYTHWDILAIYEGVLTGLRQARLQYGKRLVSLAVDSWGVDYGLLDGEGELLANPIHYRDERTREVSDEVIGRFGREAIFAETGIQFLFFNTLYQMAAERSRGRKAFEVAARFLFIPDLIHYWLTGRQVHERTIASTSQLLDPRSGGWSRRLIEGLGLPGSLFGEIIEPGTALGELRPHLRKDLGLEGLRVIAAAGHDTACAVAATPFESSRSAFLSSGTWSILGREMDHPNTSAEAMEAGFSNEVGYGGKIRFLKNICGMWLIEESRRQWARGGEEYSYPAIVELARSAPGRAAFIDPDAPELSTAGDIPARIADLCRRHGQRVPANQGEVLRIAFDSLAMKYRYFCDRLERVSGEPVECIHIVGGGSSNDFLNQMTADATGRPVIAGPSEATSLGNIAIQMIANGEIDGLAEARRIIGESCELKRFDPSGSEAWAAAADRFGKVLG